MYGCWYEEDDTGNREERLLKVAFARRIKLHKKRMALNFDIKYEGMHSFSPQISAMYDEVS